MAQKLLLEKGGSMMKRTTVLWLVLAAFLVLAGGIIFGGVMSVLRWDFTKLSTAQYETNEYEINEDYQNISIVSDTADIVFVPSENEKHSVVCYEEKNVKHTVSVKDDTLVIELVDTRKWHERIGFNIGTPKITVAVPQGEYGALTVSAATGDVELPKEFSFERIDISQSTGDVTSYASASERIGIKTGTGSIFLENIAAGALDLSVTTGRVTVTNADCREDVAVQVTTGRVILADIRCKNLRSNGSTGDLTLRNVIAAEAFDLERTTGDILLEDCDAAEISAQTDTGDVTGSLLTDKVFIAQTDTGKVDVPKTVTGGRCEITTDTGNIAITQTRT